MRKLIFVIAASITLASCSKEATHQQQLIPSNLGSLEVPEPFNWSSSYKGNFKIQFSNPRNLKVNGEIIYLVDEDLNVLNRELIYNNKAETYYHLPQIQNQKTYLYYPNTESLIEIIDKENISFTIPEFNPDVPSLKKGVILHKSESVSFKTASNLLANAAFSNSITINKDDLYTLRPTGKWYRDSYLGNTKTINGEKAYQAGNQPNIVRLTQSAAVTSGSFYQFNANQGENSTICNLTFFDSNMKFIGYHTVLESHGQTHKSGQIPMNAPYVQLVVSMKNTGWISNINMMLSSTPFDLDNDGISDHYDDYPNDASKVYRSFFPTMGKQTLAFEDLWPSMGDFDFNDMVVTNRIEFASDSSRNLIDATVSITLKAAGSGLANGLGLVLLDTDKKEFDKTIIASVNGHATLDKDVTNGIIIYDNAFSAQSSYYTNTGTGPDANPDVFTFTISFKPDANLKNIIPDFYLFRNNDRGSEIHLDGFTGTEAANAAYNNTGDDLNGSYNTEFGLPWAIEIISMNDDFKHPLEKMDIIDAYPQFHVWAASQGTLNLDWIKHPALEKIYNP